MMKKMLLLMTTAIIVMGLSTVVYAKTNNGISNFSYKGRMMNQKKINSSTYNRMIGLMKKNGFEAGAVAMKNRDFNGMRNFMNNITGDQYNQLIGIMNRCGYGVIGGWKGSNSTPDYNTPAYCINSCW